MLSPADVAAVRRVLIEDHSLDPDLALALVGQYNRDQHALPGEDLRLVEDAIDTVRRNA